jgi:hypothetical protein
MEAQPSSETHGVPGRCPEPQERVRIREVPAHATEANREHSVAGETVAGEIKHETVVAKELTGVGQLMMPTKPDHEGRVLEAPVVSGHDHEGHEAYLVTSGEVGQGANHVVGAVDTGGVDVAPSVMGLGGCANVFTV